MIGKDGFRWWLSLIDADEELLKKNTGSYSKGRMMMDGSTGVNASLSFGSDSLLIFLNFLLVFPLFSVSITHHCYLGRFSFVFNFWHIEMFIGFIYFAM